MPSSLCPCAPQCVLEIGPEIAFLQRIPAGSASETSSNAHARFWFQLVEMMIRNHIDERQLNGVE
jgi:hypothetical protein